MSSNCRSNWMTKDRLLAEPQHDARVDCPKAILIAGATIGSNLVWFHHAECLKSQSRTAMLVKRWGLIFVSRSVLRVLTCF